MWLLCSERHCNSAAACSPAGQRRSVVMGAGPNWTLRRLGSTADGPSAGPATASLPPSPMQFFKDLEKAILNFIWNKTG